MEIENMDNDNQMDMDNDNVSENDIEIIKIQNNNQNQYIQSNNNNQFNTNNNENDSGVSKKKIIKYNQLIKKKYQPKNLFKQHKQYKKNRINKCKIALDNDIKESINHRMNKSYVMYIVY